MLVRLVDSSDHPITSPTRFERVRPWRTTWITSGSRMTRCCLPPALSRLYLHHLGTAADRTGLDLLNRWGHTGETSSAVESE